MDNSIGFTDGMTDLEALEFRRLMRNQLSNKAAELAPHLFNTLQRLAFGQAEKRGPDGKLSQKYIEPSKWALEMLIERAWPIKTPLTFSFKMRPIKSASDIGGAMNEVLSAVASGELPTDEGNKILKSLEIRLKAYEDGELANKMAELQTLAERIAADRGISSGNGAKPNNGSVGHA